MRQDLFIAAPSLAGFKPSEPRAVTPEQERAIQDLIMVLGADRVRLSEAERLVFGQDISAVAPPVLAVVAPGSVEDLQVVLRIAARDDLEVVPRGGGASYTRGSVSDRPDRTLALDLTGLDQILEINAADLYAVVEAGVTWERLHQALAGQGLRARFWGTISGRVATVGGGASQNAQFWGSGATGTMAEAILGLEVVGADGQLIRTGSFGIDGANGFFRHFGPDLTGLFVGDGGAMGVKTKIVLALEPLPAVSACLSFGYRDVEGLCAVLSQSARQGLCAQQMGMDNKLRTARLADGDLRSDLQHLWKTVRGAPNLARGLWRGLKIAAAGKGLAQDIAFSTHHWIEGLDAAELAGKRRALQRLAAEVGAVEIASSIPTVMAASPFGPLNGITGPKGERWLPVHGLLPHSRALEAIQAVDCRIEQQAAQLDAHGVTTGFMCSTAGRNGFLYEPMLLWKDELTPLHRDFLGAKRLAKLPVHPVDEIARAFISKLRREIIADLDILGAVHLQIGRVYPFRARLQDGAGVLIDQIRAGLDPQGRINPGVLDG